MYADLAERAGELAGAAVALERFATIAREVPASARADALYRAGELFRRADRADDAVRCLEAALRLSDAHLPALDALEMAWRERGDLERVAVILGRKVAATARHPARQKSLLSRLGDLQAQLERPDVALATHQRALEIDPSWRPSLRHVTQHLRDTGALGVAAGGFAQLSGELPGDGVGDAAAVIRDRTQAAASLAALIGELDDATLDTVRDVALPALERASAPSGSPTQEDERAAALARLRGERQPRTAGVEETTHSGRTTAGTALNLRDAAARAKAAGKLDDALATLETANHVSPGDPYVLRELAELAGTVGDHEAAARHLDGLARVLTGGRRGDALLELADICYDRLDDASRARIAMRQAADAFGSGSRRDATLRLLANEAATHLAWDVVCDALGGVSPERRTGADLKQLAIALARAGRDADAVAAIEDASAQQKLDDGGTLLAALRAELVRKDAFAVELERRAGEAGGGEAAALHDEADAVWRAIGKRRGGAPDLRIVQAAESETDVDESSIEAEADADADGFEQPSAFEQRTTDRDHIAVDEHGVAAISMRTTLRGHPAVVPPVTSPGALSIDAIPERVRRETGSRPSITITGTDDEQRAAVALAAASADRDRLIGAHRAAPDDPAVLAAVLLNLGDREPALRRNVLESAAATSSGRAQAIALHELALIARGNGDPIRAAALWNKAHRADASYAPVWMPLADALAAADDLDTARELYERVAASEELDADRRQWAAERAAALGHDDSVVSGEIGGPAAAPAPPPLPLIPPPPAPARVPAAELARARELADAEQWHAAIELAERVAASATAEDASALELLESLYVDAGDPTAASEAIGRQLVLVTQPAQRAKLWRRRARLYRDVIGREAEAYRCLKEAHALAPADPEIAYQLRIAAMVRGEWALVASLLYRELSAATSPRERGALHFELALVFEERLDDAAQAQVNLEQAIAFDPTIPAAHAPLARRYELLGRFEDAAALYDTAAAAARPADRASLLEAAARCRTNAGGAEPIVAMPAVPTKSGSGPVRTPTGQMAPLARPDAGDRSGGTSAAQSARISGSVAIPTPEAARISGSVAIPPLPDPPRARTASAPPSASASDPDSAALEAAEVAGDLDVAFTLASTLWAGAPGHPAAFRTLATAYRAAGDLSSLAPLVMTRVEHASTADERARAWLELAALADELGAFDQAARAYDHALIEDPGNIAALDARGDLAFRTGDLATAEYIYRDLAPGESLLGDDDLAYRRSQIAEALGHADEALQLARAAVAAAPGRRDLVERVYQLSAQAGDLELAIDAATALLDLVPLDDDDALLAAQLALVELLRAAGDYDAATAHLEHVVRDHPQHVGAIEALADVHIARGDWPTATRYLYQLVPLAPSAPARADRLYQLGEAVLVHLGDIDRADDVFLRASDLDPGHVPTLRRLLDVYWRADDPGALVEVAGELVAVEGIDAGQVAPGSLAQALIAAALVGDTQLATRLGVALGREAPSTIVAALGELAGKDGRLQLGSAATAVTELARRGVLGLGDLRAAAAGSPVELALQT